MRILVTGCNGFVGRYISQFLLESGHEVYGIGTKLNTSVRLSGYYKADIVSQPEIEQLASTICRLDCIVHCAAYISYDATDSRVMLVNVAGTQNIVSLASKTGAEKIIYISGIPVIGVPCILPITEEHPVSPVTMYHVSKLAGEYIIKASNLRHIILRFASPVGIGMNPRSILPTFLENCLQGREISLYGNGSRVQNYVPVQEVARAVCCSLRPGSADGCYNLAGKSVSNYELACLCREITNSKSEIRFNGKPDFTDNQIWDISDEKIRKEMGYSPQVTLEDAIKEMVGYFRSKD